MGQGQDPYQDGGGFTPYRPDATPDEEPPAGAEAAPFVPYSGEPVVPYGGSAGPQVYVTTTSITPSGPTGGRALPWLPWLIGLGVLVAGCGGGVVAVLVAAVDGVDSVEVSDSDQVFVNDLQEGQCVIGAGLDPGNSDPVSGLEVVECSTAHDAEVLAVNVLDADEAARYDIDDNSQIDANCRRYFSDRETELLREGDYFIWALTETREPVRDDKVACLVVNADGAPLHGPVDMAGREGQG